MPKLGPVSYGQLARVLEADGFRCIREEGDHMVFIKPGVIRPVIIPKYASQRTYALASSRFSASSALSALAFVLLFLSPRFLSVSATPRRKRMFCLVPPLLAQGTVARLSVPGDV
jgi:predicted RNA binding protein YcfA (HicA-like mRNA interferase family)